MWLDSMAHTIFRAFGSCCILKLLWWGEGGTPLFCDEKRHESQVNRREDEPRRSDAASFLPSRTSQLLYSQWDKRHKMGAFLGTSWEMRKNDIQLDIHSVNASRWIYLEIENRCYYLSTSRDVTPNSHSTTMYRAEKPRDELFTTIVQTDFRQ